MASKEAFLKQKITNFTIFIEKKIGTDNNTYRDFVSYQSDLNSFLRDIIAISKQPINSTTINQYFDFKAVKAKISKEDIEVVGKYFEMFIKVIN